MHTTSENRKKPQQRIDKKLGWLETSRDTWKEKAKIAKNELKKKKLAVKRTRETRDSYKDNLERERKAHLENREELAQKELEITLLKEQLEIAQQQIHELKKKR